MIPISLKVSIDVAKYVYALFIEWDRQMYDGETDSFVNVSNTYVFCQWTMIANTSSITEDLGQIEYIFSDKTGSSTVLH